MDCQSEIVDGQMAISLKDKLIYSDTAQFGALLQEIKTATPKSCVVNLSELASIDSTGLRMFLLIHDVCKTTGTDLTFVKASGQVKDLLLHSRFDTIVRIED